MVRKLHSRYPWYYALTPPEHVATPLWRHDLIHTVRLHEGERLETLLRITRQQGRAHSLEWGKRADRWLQEQIWLALKMWEWDHLTVRREPTPKRPRGHGQH